MPTERRVVGTSEDVIKGTGLPQGSDSVRWRDICRAAANDKTMLAKVTGDERYRLNGITRAVKDKVTRRQSSLEGSLDFGDQNHLKISSISESLATSSSPPFRPLELELAPPPRGTPPEAAALQRKSPQLERARSGTSGSTSSPQSSSASLAEVPRSPSSNEGIVRHVPSKDLLPGRQSTFNKSGLPEREQHQFLDICKNGDFERVKEFLKVNPLYINVRPCGRWSALHQFAYNGDSEAIQYLLDKLADPSARTPEGHTPAEVAQARVAKLLHTSSRREREARPRTSLQVVCLLCSPCSVKKTPVRPPNA